MDLGYIFLQSIWFYSVGNFEVAAAIPSAIIAAAGASTFQIIF